MRQLKVRIKLSDVPDKGSGAFARHLAGFFGTVVGFLDRGDGYHWPCDDRCGQDCPRWEEARQAADLELDIDEEYENGGFGNEYTVLVKEVR